jgi:hypothetical protein
MVEQHRTTKLYGARSEKQANIDVQNAEYLDLLGILESANYGAVTNYRDMPPRSENRIEPSLFLLTRSTPINRAFNPVPGYPSRRPPSPAHP